MRERVCPECDAPGLQARAGRLVCVLCGRALPANGPPEFSVVVPVYNSAAILPALVDRLAKVFDEMDCSFELLLVDDCSRDESWRVIEDLRSVHPFIRAWRLMRNFGQLILKILSGTGGVLHRGNSRMKRCLEKSSNCSAV